MQIILPDGNITMLRNGVNEFILVDNELYLDQFLKLTITLDLDFNWNVVWVWAKVTNGKDEIVETDCGDWARYKSVVDEAVRNVWNRRGELTT